MHKPKHSNQANPTPTDLERLGVLVDHLDLDHGPLPGPGGRELHAVRLQVHSPGPSPGPGPGGSGDVGVPQQAMQVGWGEECWWWLSPDLVSMAGSRGRSGSETRSRSRGCGLSGQCDTDWSLSCSMHW